MTDHRQLKLTLHLIYPGTYSSAWRVEGSTAQDLVDPKFFVRNAQIAERGTFDAVFLADNLIVPDGAEHRIFYSLEPTVLLATIAAATEFIGLVGTISTSYNEPFNVARRIASLDHVSGGRAGWNIVTTADHLTHRNFGLPQPPSHSERYARASEFADVVAGLWDSWEDGALLGDKAEGLLVDTARLHPIAHKGAFFEVHGPLNVPRTPQGRPVLVQAGASEDGVALAGRHAELVFAMAHSIEEAAAYKARLDAAARSAGRQAGDVSVLPGIVPILGSTEEEARRREAELWNLVPIQHGLNRLGFILGIDPARLSLDEPLPRDLALPQDRTSHTFFRKAINRADSDKLTVRQLIKAQGGGTSHRIFVGTPEQFADDIERWFRSGAVDGFNIMSDVLPSGLETFVDHVVPLLRRRGTFREAYEHRTLRGHLGKPAPANRFTRGRESAA